MRQNHTSKFKPTERQEQTAATLRRMYEEPRLPENMVELGLRNRTTRALNSACDYGRQYLAEGFSAYSHRKHPSSFYLAACADHASKQDQTLGDRLTTVEYYAEEVRKWWAEIIEPRVKKRRPRDLPTKAAGARGRERRETVPAKRAPSAFKIVLKGGAPSLGFIAGEIVKATATLDPQVWEMVALWRPDEEKATVGRVVSVTESAVTLRLSDHEEATFDRAGLEFLGRINPEPIGRDDGLSAEQRKRVAELRHRLDDVNADDITNSTSLLKLEKQIYDIEHPIAPAHDPDAWPEELRVVGE